MKNDFEDDFFIPFVYDENLENRIVKKMYIFE